MYFTCVSRWIGNLRNETKFQQIFWKSYRIMKLSSYTQTEINDGIWFTILLFSSEEFNWPKNTMTRFTNPWIYLISFLQNTALYTSFSSSSPLKRNSITFPTSQPFLSQQRSPFEQQWPAVTWSISFCSTPRGNSVWTCKGSPVIKLHYMALCFAARALTEGD